MMRPAISLHPDFEELSTLADRTDLEAGRTRAGRHVARCGVCAATVAEIRALGDRVRASQLPGAPSTLWERIERRVDHEVEAHGRIEERMVPMLPVGDITPRMEEPREPRSLAPIVRRSVLGVLLVATAALALVALEPRERLAAATPRRLVADQDVAQPGGAVTLHYRPVEALASQPELTVWMLVPGKHVRGFDEELERAGTLRRVSSLEYTGAVTMPEGTPMALLVIGDSTGDVIDRTEGRAGRLPLTVLAADAHGRPRLDALVMALGLGRGSPDRATMQRWVGLMREYYPKAPETMILSGVHAPRSIVGDIVKLFESKERQYYGWHDRLEHRAALSEEVETMMANVGWELMDTARADFWTQRLLHDHPTSRFLPALWIQRYRDVPDDSVETVLSDFEPIYTRAGAPREALARAITLADRSGDSTLIRRWHLRADPGEISSALVGELSRFAGNHDALADVRRRLLVALADADSAAREGPTLFARSRYFAWFQRERVRTRLAALALLEGNARSAKDSLDVIVAEFAARPTCQMPETMRWRAEAARRLGSMAEARADYAYVVVMSDWRITTLSDSMPTLLGDTFKKDSWDRALVSARTAKQDCWNAQREAARRTTR